MVGSKKKAFLASIAALLAMIGFAVPSVAQAGDKIVNGNFSYPNNIMAAGGPWIGAWGSPPQKGNWCQINPNNGQYCLSDLTIYGPKSIPNWSFRNFAWRSDQSGTSQHPPNAVELQIDISGNQYGEIIAAEQGRAIYQDIDTLPGGVYHWELRHAPLSNDGEKVIDQMRVEIAGATQYAKRLTSNGISFSGAAGYHQSDDTNSVGYISTIIETPGGLKGNSGRSHEGEWEKYEGWYLCPAGQTTTRFSFRSVSAGTNVGIGEGYDSHGNIVDDISFEVYYPLWYDGNGGTYVDSRLYTGAEGSGAFKNYKNYYRQGTSPSLVRDPNISRPSENGRSFSFEGWSTTKQNTPATSAAQLNAAGVLDKNVSPKYPSIKSNATNNRVYAVWARNPQVTFKKEFGTTTQTISGPTTCTYGAQANSPAVPSVTGYTFKYWRVDTGTANTIANGSSYRANVTEDTVVTAVYEPNPYKIHFERNLTPWTDKDVLGGTMADQSMVYDRPANLNPNQFTSLYYDFDKWKRNSTGVYYNDRQQVINLTAERDHVVRLYGQWIPKPINEIDKWCDAADGQYNIDNTVTYTVKATQTVPGATAYATTFTDTLNANGMDMVANGASYITDSVQITGPNGPVSADKIDRIQWSADHKSFSVKVREPITEGQSLTMTYKVKLGTTTTKSLQGKTWYNTATVYADNTPKPEPVRTKTIPIYVRLPELKASKSVDKELIDSGDIVTYTFKVWNEGDPGSLIYNAGFADELSPWLLDDGVQILYDDIRVVDASGTDITSQVNPVLEGTTFKIETNTHIPKNQILTATVPMRIGDRSSTVSGNAYKDILSSVSDNGDLKQAEALVKVTKPNLQSSKTADKPTINTGETVGFTVKIRNATENSRAYNVSFTDALDAESIAGGAYIDAATLRIYDQNGTDITYRSAVYWQSTNGYTTALAAATPAVLAGNDEITVTYNVIAGEAGSTQLQDSKIGNVVTTASSNGGPGGGDEDIVTIYTPLLAIDKSAAKNITPINGDADYTIDVWQRNEAAIAWNIVIEDKIGEEAVAAGVSYNRDSVVITDQYGTDRTAEIRNAGGIHFSDDGTFMTINTPISLGNSEHMSVTYSVHYGDADDVRLQGKKWTNYASARAANSRTSPGDEANVAVPTPGIVASKTADKTSINTGDTVVFTFTARQSVPDAVAWNISFADEVPEELIAAGGSFDINSIEIKGPNGENLKQASNLSFVGNRLVVETNSEIGYEQQITVTAPFTFGRTDSTALVSSMFTDKLTTSSSNSTPSQDEESVFVMEPDLTVVKYHDADVIDLTGRIGFTVAAKNIADGTIAYKPYIDDHLSDEAYEAGAYIDKETLHVRLGNGSDVTSDCSVSWSDPEQPSGVKVIYNGSLAFDEEMILTYEVVAGDETSTTLYETGVDNLATAGAANSRYTGTADSHTSFFTPELRVDKSTEEKAVDVGDSIHYRVVVTETKESATAFGIIIEDAMDDESVKQGAYIDTSSLVLYDENGDKIETPNISWSLIAEDHQKASGYKIETGRDLKCGQTLTVTYTVVAGSDSDAQLGGISIANLARARATNVSDEAFAEASAEVISPNIVTEKRASSDNISVHDAVHYIVSVTQTEDGASAKNVCISDELSWKGDKKLVDTDAVIDSLVVKHNGVEIKPIKVDKVVMAAEGAQDDEWTLVIYIDTAERLYYEDTLTVEYDVKYGEEINGLIMDAQSVRNVANATISNGSPSMDDAVVYVNDAILDIQKTVHLDNENEKAFYHIELRQTNPAAVAQHVVIIDSVDVDSANVGVKMLPDTMNIMFNGEKVDVEPIWDVEYDNAIGFTIDLGRNVGYDDLVTIDYTVDLYDIPFMGVVDLKNVASAKASNSIEARAFSYATWDSGVEAVPMTRMMDAVMMVATGDGLPFIIAAVFGGGAIAMFIRFYLKRRHEK